METPQQRVVLAAVQLPGISDAEFEANMAELKRLVDTLGFLVIGQVCQRRKRLDSGVVFGEGKLHELAQWTGGSGVVHRGPRKKPGINDVEADEEETPLEVPEDLDLLPEEQDEFAEEVEAPKQLADIIIVDNELSPMQLRNLERATDAEVMDRTGVIVEIFHRHASSREARLQVEIARLVYMAPRLRETGGQRQKGGIGQKGAGESSLELDRRRIRDRIAELREVLASIEGEARTRRARRQEAQRVALVGYTNAGKSSLMRGLTGSEVYVADKLFATLDTTVRMLWPETRPRILVSDTVGFIKKLPHDLVASFRSTLDEALEASLLLHVVDASDPAFRDQFAVTRTVLGEIGAGDVPSLLLFNKSDLLEDARRAELAAEFPDAVFASARTVEGLQAVRDVIIHAFQQQMQDADFVVPYAKSSLIGEFHKVHVVSEVYEEDGIHYSVKADAGALARLAALVGVDTNG